MATFRRYGVSIDKIGIGQPFSWAEACDLVEAAMSDSSTELFAAVAGWDFPMSHVEMLLVIAAYGKESYKVMPFDTRSQVSDEEVAAAHEELLEEIKFS